jgi:RAP1 GTPase activating protein 1
MFHVATMLPLDQKDQEQPILERKRHIGNDVIVLIFKEGNTPIDPSTIFRSQFNRSFTH